MNLLNISLSPLFSLSFYQFATNEAIQRTEAYEYAQSLGSQHCSLPNFQVSLHYILSKHVCLYDVNHFNCSCSCSNRQLEWTQSPQPCDINDVSLPEMQIMLCLFIFRHQVFKLIYACRLAEAGLCAQAFHYCEVISKTVLTQPSYYSPVLINQLVQVCQDWLWFSIPLPLSIHTFPHFSFFIDMITHLIFVAYIFQMSEKLRFFDPQLKERPEQELFNEPEWLIHLRQLDGQFRVRRRNFVVSAFQV